MRQPSTTRRKPNRIRRMFRALLMVYLVVVAIIFLAHPADRIIMVDNHAAVDAHGARREMISVGPNQVEVWIARSPGAATQAPAAFILAFVGQGDRADRWVWHNAQSWGAKPVEVWSMNYPGSGGSSGPNLLGDIAPAALATFDRLHALAAGRPIIVQGASLGTTPALCVAARRPVAALTLHNPLPLRQLILGCHGWWNLWLLAGPIALEIPGDLDGVLNAARITASAIFLLSDHDEVIPPAYHDLIVNAYAGPKRIVTLRGALHNSEIDGAAQAQFAHDVGWLWAQAVPASMDPSARAQPAGTAHYSNTLHGPS